MKNKNVIIHFAPLELYPPIMNLLDFLSSCDNQLDILVISTAPNASLRRYENSNINVKRFKPIIPTDNAIIKLGRYFTFYLLTFYKLLRKNPKNVLYFETLSALSAILYKSVIKNVNLYAHYHEIVTLEELSKGRTLNKLINNFERKNYKKYRWISQTNETRLSFFAKQYDLNEASPYLNILPNYPPQSWITQPKNPREKNNITKLVHIGALSLKGMYLQEALNRFGSNPHYTIDFYSHKFPNDVKEAILQHDNCAVNGAIDYKDIPNLKGFFDVGLVLYKALSSNVQYCAPNKIFEYLALDLDVWCSDKLITARDYERLECYPKMMLLNYENLESFDFEKALDKSNLSYLHSPYICETVYRNLLNALNENINS